MRSEGEAIHEHVWKGRLGAAPFVSQKLPRTGRYDLVTAFECVHDVSQPVGALKAMRQLAGDTGAVLVVDERVGDTFTVSGNDIEWMMYGWSILHCLPVGKADAPSAETGTVLRPDTLRRYAMDAGFRRMEILPIDNLFFRFYGDVPVRVEFEN